MLLGSYPTDPWSKMLQRYIENIGDEKLSVEHTPHKSLTSANFIYAHAYHVYRNMVKSNAQKKTLTKASKLLLPKICLKVFLGTLTVRYYW